MHIVKRKKIDASTLLALDPILVHRPTSENTQNDEGAKNKEDSVNAGNHKTAKAWIQAVGGEQA